VPSPTLPSQLAANATCEEHTQVRSRFQELRGKGESDGCEVGYTYEPVAPACQRLKPEGLSRITHFRKMLSSVLNLEPSSGGLSTAALAGVTALLVSLALRAEAVVEPGWAWSAERSAIVLSGVLLVRVERMAVAASGKAPGGSSYVVVKCGSALRVGHGLARGI
jgi:hypothetical protein